MKTLISIVVICITIHFANAQSFTELAYQACKTTVDTCESIEKLKPCQETYMRLFCIQMMPKSPSMENHKSMIGPNNLPTTLVPKI